LIVPIGEWVLHRACAEAATWRNDIKVAVNLSPVQLRSRDLTQVVVLALANSGLPATRLELEITESVFLEDNDLTLSILHDLRRLGVRIAMDDFGTGYSSLSYLRSFPFGKIKLDRSFVRDLEAKPDSLAIVQSIAALGGSLGMITTAEGVETEAQMRLLQEAGFDEGQGYLFGRPEPAHQISKREADAVSRAA
jgi:EAL domain-containing protein (putative c-di-GMP-specific phosphodiesterase class I)